MLLANPIVKIIQVVESDKSHMPILPCEFLLVIEMNNNVKELVYTPFICPYDVYESERER